MHDALQNLLHRVQRLHRRQVVLRVIMLTLAAFGVAFLAAILIDATFALPTAALLLTSGLLLVVLLAGVIFIARSWRATRFEPRRIARLLERRLNIQDSRFINAVEFAPPPVEGPAVSVHADGSQTRRDEQAQARRDQQAQRVSDDLRRLAVEQGESAARDAPLRHAVDRRPTLRASGAFAGVLCLLLITGLVAPRLYTMGIPRLLHPAGDHPPFTLLDFDVATTPERVHVGYDAAIHAAIASPTEPPTRAAVVFTDREQPERVPMLRTADGQFTLPIESASESRRFYIDTADGRSGRHELHVLPTPTFEAASVEYRYPDYTGWPADRRALTDRGVRAMQGATVHVTVQSNLPLDHGRWQFDDDRTVTFTPDPDDPTVARGSFTLQRSGSFRLSLVAADGHESIDSLTGPVEAIADDDPFVQIIDPDLRLIAPPGWDVPLRALATDDVAVDRMVLRRSVNRESTETEPLDVAHRRDGRTAEAARVLSLSTLGAAVGDTITGFVTAYDNHPTQPRSGDSETFTIRVVSDEEYREFARRQYQAEDVAAEMAQLREHLENLAEQREQLIEELDALREQIAGQADRPTPEQQERLEELRERIDAYADRLDQLADAMRRRAEQYDLYTFESPYREMLEQMADTLAQDAAAARERAAPLAGGSPEDLDAALDELRRQQQRAAAQREETELTEQQIRQLRAAQRMQAEAQRIIAITHQQRRIADRLSPYADLDALDSAERTRAARLGQQQDALHEELAAALQRLEAAASESRDLLPTMADSGRQIVQAIGEMDVPGDQESAAASAFDGAGRDAWGHADAAATKLESLLSQCEAMCDGGSLAEIDNPLSLSQSQMGQSVSEMASATPSAGSPSQGAGSGGGAGVAGAAGAPAGGEGATGPGSRFDGFVAAAPNASAASASTVPGPFDLDSEGFGLAGQSAARATEQPGLAETINVDDPDRRRSAPPHAAGVPLEFRDMTQQYFRRLAEDSSTGAQP